MTQLEEAEQELYEWATGSRSYSDLQMSVQSGSRGEMLVLASQQDAAEIQRAYWAVRALRLLDRSQVTSRSEKNNE